MHFLQATALLFPALIASLVSATAIPTADIQTTDLAGPRPVSNATHTVALTNDNGASDPYWMFLPRDWNTTGSDDAAKSLLPRFMGPTYVNVYNSWSGPACQSETVNQFIPENVPCTCCIPFNGGSTFGQVFVPSEVQGFSISLYTGSGLGNCNTFAEQLYQYAGCFVGPPNFIGLAFFSAWGC